MTVNAARERERVVAMVRWAGRPAASAATAAESAVERKPRAMLYSV